MSVNGTLTTKFNRGSKNTAKHDRDHDKRWNVQILEKKNSKKFHNEKNFLRSKAELRDFE